MWVGMRVGVVVEVVKMRVGGEGLGMGMRVGEWR